MANPGFYSDHVQWLQHSLTKETSYGQEKETWTSIGWLWCKLEETSGRSSKDYGAEQSGAELEIRIRNYPAISTLDRFFSPKWNQTYIIDTIRRGDNELIVDAHVYDDLTI